MSFVVDLSKQSKEFKPQAECIGFYAKSSLNHHSWFLQTKFKPLELSQLIKQFNKPLVCLRLEDIETTRQLLADNQLKQLLANQQLFFFSKNPNILRLIKDSWSDSAIVLIEPWRSYRASHLALKLGTKYVAMDSRWLYASYIHYKSRHLYLFGYNLKTKSKAKRFIDAGLYAAIV